MTEFYDLIYITSVRKLYTYLFKFMLLKTGKRHRVFQQRNATLHHIDTNFEKPADIK